MVASMAKRFSPVPPRRLRPAATLAAVAALVAACHRGAADGKTDAGPDASAAPLDDGGTAITAPLPEPVLAGIVGCWQLGDLEQWTITRTPQAGAQIVRKVLPRGSEGMPPDYARRAAVSSDIQYDASLPRLAFDTAGPKHGLLFVFEITPDGLAGSWYSARAAGTGNFQPTGKNAALRRCGLDGGTATPR